MTDHISPEQAERVYQGLDDARQAFGAARLRLGAALALTLDFRLWHGRAESWAAFLADHRLHPSAARDFITIARAFVLDPSLAPQADDEKAAVAGASVKVLKRAIEVMTPANRDEVYAIIGELGNLDALEALTSFTLATAAISTTSPQRDPRVASVLNQFYQLPMEARIEAMACLGMRLPATGTDP